MRANSKFILLGNRTLIPQYPVNSGGSLNAGLSLDETAVLHGSIPSPTQVSPIIYLLTASDLWAQAYYCAQGSDLELNTEDICNFPEYFSSFLP